MDLQQTTISSQGQIFLPLLLRKRYGLDKGDKIIFLPDEKGIYLKRVPRKLTDALRGVMGRDKHKKTDVDKLHKKWKKAWEKR
jgi:AbrB family looped-hinge helix DNA binding protein